MGKYRKKPVVIEATRFWPDIEPWPDGVYELEPTGDYYEDMDMYCIDTLEGTVYVRAGDWVISGVAGEKYPCRDDIFRATYELVQEQEQTDGETN